MTSRRNAKVAQAIRETVSTAILFHLRDPRVQHVTVTRVEVAGDLRTARIYVSVRGDERTESLSMHGLNSARGFLQSRIADRLKIRHTPVLRFILDDGIKRSVEAAEIISNMLNEADCDNPSPGEYPIEHQ